MNNSVAYMSDSFEAKKNTQASMMTLGVAGLILLIFILIKMDFPTFETPITDNDIEDNDKESPPVLKPDNPKPTATKINTNHSVVKTEPKPVVETPTPPRPKAVLGKTLGGSSTGGGTADDYDRSGYKGTGNGVGNGPGTGGGSGTGNGGGNGPGNGPGTGPKNLAQRF